MTDPLLQTIPRRVGLFLAGGLGSYAVNLGLFWLFFRALGLPERVAYAIGLVVLAALLFLWNYFFNFPTGQRWGTSAVRYLLTIAVSYAGNYALVCAGMAIWPPRHWPLVILAAQIGIAACKFLVFHLWVYPPKRGEGDVP